MEQICQKCRNTQLYPDQQGLRCSGCGHVYSKATPHNQFSGVVISVDIESTESAPKLTKKRDSRLDQEKSAYDWETRKEYLHRNGVLEEEILTDEVNGVVREYWTEDNYKTGETIKKYIPKRLFHGSK